MKTAIRRGFILLIALLTSAIVAGDRQELAAPRFAIDRGLLETGDLIFRRGLSFASRLVLLADPQPLYSHVGLLLVNGSEALVIHVVPAQAATDPAPVQVEPLATFIDRQHTSAVSVMRVEHIQARHYAAQAAAAASGYAREALSFDDQFDLESIDRMYCTELVWRAYLEAGIDLVDGVFPQFETPFGTGSFLPPSSLLGSPYLREIVSLPT